MTAPVKKPIPKVKPAKAVISVSVNKPLIFTNSIDNIAGSVFAAMNNGRVIILSKSKIDVEQVKRYLISNKKQISKIYILGGTKAINTKLEKLMKSISIKYVIRIGGADKYETAALLAGLMKLDKGTPVILTADGTKSEILDKIVKANAKTKYPILLTNKNNINSYAKKTIDDIKPKKIYIVGDENVISKAQIDDIIKSFKLKASDIVWIKVSNDVKKIK